MTADISIRLTSGQIAQVVRESADAGVLEQTLAGVAGVEKSRGVVLGLLAEGRKHSRSVLRAVLVLSAIPMDGSWCELTTIAALTGLSKPTIHRYLDTWKGLGLIQQDPDSRLYRRGKGLCPEIQED